MTHPLLTENAKRVIGAVVRERVDEQVDAALLEALGPPSVLTPELREALSEVIADDVPAALAVALGTEPASGAVDGVASALCEAVAGVQREELTRAAGELPDRLVADFAGDLDEVLLEMAVEDTLRANAAANAAALRLLESRLQRVLASPRDVREAAVREALEVERVRLNSRSGRRFARALSHALSQMHGEPVRVLSELEAS